MGHSWQVGQSISSLQFAEALGMELILLMRNILVMEIHCPPPLGHTAEQLHF
jgi:hypothetical protein